MNYDIILEGAKMKYIYFLVQFSSPISKHLVLKLRSSAIKIGLTLVHTALSPFYISLILFYFLLQFCS